MIGIIPKNFVLTLLEGRAFYRNDSKINQPANFAINADRSNSAADYSIDKKSIVSRPHSDTIQKVGLNDDKRYPETPANMIMHWTNFCQDFWSKDKVYNKEHQAVCEYYRYYMVDFRPYLIESPVTVFTTDSLKNCVELMRNMYLRHLIVISPTDGKLEGIITRQDLFAWLDL